MRTLSSTPHSANPVARERDGRRRRRTITLTVLSMLVILLVAASLMLGNTFYPPGDVTRVLLGQDVPGASFTVGRLRLPRVALAVIAGVCFGLGGVTFQTMLRNPLASPDIIGISSGASAAAVVGIVFWGLSGTLLSVFAIVVALGVALTIYLLSFRRGVHGTRLILIGIGIAAMLESVTSYALSKAPQWELQEAMRWITGSINGTRWSGVVPVAVALAVFGPILLAQARNLSQLQLGEETAAALGVRVERTRLLLVTAAVGLIAFATSAAGPVAFVAFLSGPIAARIVRHGSLLIPAALVGSVLVLAGDLIGQLAFDTRYPVGVVTGALGAPYLLYLIIRTNRTGRSL
ncbi:ABC transporter permease [Aeromicrobium sp. PE09-221]|uniref:FecCD family ABC transporter permease n=1 Tax=Aeromicrobium sp. PE09-221 TaxID=1898043 RepID=UPI000B68552F|nr:iron chelate uptake ABC transporter family permease subunit [Aeromicrobium sp. PE09-221]OUZ09154.1 ABC transporter permease [Aeromicrobium sp. PE09-221]